MALISDIITLKQFIGGAGNVSLSIESIAPFLDMVGEEYLRPWLGDELYDDLVANPTGDILPHVQRPLALLTMEAYSRINEIQIGSQGNFRIEDEKRKSIYKYQGNEYRSVMFQTGYQSIERMLKYLDKNAATYPLWTDSFAFKTHRSPFLNYATDFQHVYSRNINRFVFEIIRPAIQEIQEGVIRPILGDDFYEELQQKRLDGTLTDKQKELIRCTWTPLAHFAIKEAMERNWVQFEGNSIVQYEKLGDQSTKKATLAKNEPVAVQFRHNEEFANRSLSKIHAFLKKNIEHEDLEIYKNWQKEQQAIAILSDYLCREITETDSELDALIVKYLDENCQLLPEWQNKLHHTHSHIDETGHFHREHHHHRSCYCVGTCRCPHPPEDYEPRGTAFL